MLSTRFFVVKCSWYNRGVSQIKQIGSRFLTLLRKHPLRWAFVCVFLVIIILYVIAFAPKNIIFSYSSLNCTRQYLLLPQLLTPSDNENYEIMLTDPIEVFNYPIMTKSLCVNAKQSPDGEQESVTVAPFGGMIARKTYIITPESTPSVSSAPLLKPIPATKPIDLPLSHPDSLHAYFITSGDKSAPCKSSQKVLRCEVDKLALEQGKSAEVTVDRYFQHKKIATIVQKKVAVLEATQVVDSSVKENQVIYNKPKEFSVALDKSLKRASMELVRKDGDKEVLVASSASIDQSTVHLKVENEEEMVRSSSYILKLTSVEANDGSGLGDVFRIPFTLSGGPKVSSVSVGSHDVPLNASIQFTFDQPIKADSDIRQFVSIVGANAVITRSGERTVRVVLQNTGRCVGFSVVVKKGIISDNEVTSTNDWSFNSRTRCATSETIGYSVKGRPIVAHTYGNGATTYLFTGAIHGNELSSNYTMKNWMADLEANPGRIPANARVIVIPAVSPDGVASANRLNANGVNLNRNFPTSNWTQNIITSSGEQAGGGGSAAASEPETRALMNFSSRVAPRLVTTHHSSGSLVNSNDVGISIAAGQDYSRLAGYRFIPNSATTGTFGFEMTGTYEDWLLERGTPAILVELNTDTGNHYARNKSALWAMLGK